MRGMFQVQTSPRLMTTACLVLPCPAFVPLYHTHAPAADSCHPCGLHASRPFSSLSDPFMSCVRTLLLFLVTPITYILGFNSHQTPQDLRVAASPTWGLSLPAPLPLLCPLTSQFTELALPRASCLLPQGLCFDCALFPECSSLSLDGRVHLVLQLSDGLSRPRLRLGHACPWASPIVWPKQP